MKYVWLGVLTAGLFTTFTTSSAQTASAPLRVAIAGMVHGHVEGFFQRSLHRTDIQIVGISEPDTKVAARYAAHACGKGARYTRSHPPRRLLTVIDYPDRSSASAAEYAVKQMSAVEKRAYALLLALGNATSRSG